VRLTRDITKAKTFPTRTAADSVVAEIRAKGLDRIEVAPFAERFGRTYYVVEISGQGGYDYLAKEKP